MQKELDYFVIEHSYGGRQDWFWDPAMKIGGCAAVTACDSSIYFDCYKGTTGLYPFEKTALTKKDYVKFGMKMKPYLKPRHTGINSLDLYIEGYGKYLEDKDCHSIRMRALPGTESAEDAKQALIHQIDAGFPVPCLLLKHENPLFSDYVWHWFLLTGYDTAGDSCMARAVTYGESRWLDMDDLWNTGHAQRGGLILYETPQ
ncbi:hypothetical protein H8S44_08785 [Anaerosacchariphilus sp. NSJ-68]|uniref:Uncharacterized protein n=2 Tax=Lachnospiraceae TaxID=186803 RepID=A0A923LC36_9FIRM|nr:MULTISPECIES: hypothetical protein [Lachnospiraceae]MBC5659865.1 hypothetical protein [Anaerosacchariphilus hominis]MBC5697532.1 hypothetical protein [Roseburia difficilis]